MGSDAAELVERERDWHNERFADSEARGAQEKFYVAIAQCKEAYAAAIARYARSAVVLDYGCATGRRSLEVAAIAERVFGIDISDVAIKIANEAASQASINNALFEVRDAHSTGFPDQTFDFVFGMGIIHHLDTEMAFEEVRRVLKPNGCAVFMEPIGHNPIMNLYRKFTPNARTTDEHPLLKADFEVSRSVFGSVEWRFFGLFTMIAVPLRKTRFGAIVLRVAQIIDKFVLSLPLVKWQAWHALIILKR